MPDVFHGRGRRIDGLLHLYPREALECVHAGATILDVRDGIESSGRSFAVDRVLGISRRVIADRLSSLPRDAALIVADCVGVHSKEIVRLLASRGFRAVANLVGGMVDWESAGMPTRVDGEEELLGGCACRLRPRKDYRVPDDD